MKTLRLLSLIIAFVHLSHAEDSVNEIQIATNLYLKVMEEIKGLQQLKHSMESQLRSLNSKHLAKLLCASSNSEEMKTTLQSQVQMLYKNYNQDLVQDILAESISELRGCKTSSQLTDWLRVTSEDDDISMFELLLQAQLLLYHTYARSHYVNSTNIQAKLAFSVNKIRELKLYESVRGSLKQQVQSLLKMLPENLRYLLFESHFCLMSSAYSEYAYTSLGGKNIDSTSRYVWVWYEKLFIDDSGHIKATVFESNPGQRSDLAVKLIGTKFNIYYYMMPSTNLVAAWDLTGEPQNSIWNIEFVDDDRVVFYQDDYIMCSTDEKYNTQRRLVRGYQIGEYTAQSSECQWLLGKCDRK